MRAAASLIALASAGTLRSVTGEQDFAVERACFGVVSSVSLSRLSVEAHVASHGNAGLRIMTCQSK